MTKRVRVRFAPSPTGYLHIGGIRTALFNYIYALKHNGRFFLRIEDTDHVRSKKKYIDSILDSINWLGFTPYEGPIYQSERLNIYKKYAEQLVKERKAYYCYCTKEDIKKEKLAAEKNKVTYKYSGKCRAHIGEKEKNISYSIRIKNIKRKNYIIKDLIRGDVKVNSDEFDDYIIVKSNGTPTYSFACVIDDHLLNISHVIRGEDHITNTFKQLIIYDLLKWEYPTFAHIPLIHSTGGRRLSKRHGATALIEYKNMGYLREVLINYLSLLGWSPKTDKEIFDIDFLIENFKLEDISKNSAQFDIEKLNWMNGVYLFGMDIEKKAELVISYVEKYYKYKLERKKLINILCILGPRGRTLKEIWEHIKFFYKAPIEYAKGIDIENRNKIISLIEKTNFNDNTLEEAIREFCHKTNMKLQKIAQFIRVAISGEIVSLGIFESMKILGKQETLNRLMEYEKWLKKVSS